MSLRFISGMLTGLSVLCGGMACAQNVVTQPHVEIRLIAERPSVVSGETLTLALRQTLEQGWHTYWVNPGDAGEATHVEWQLPPGFTAGALQWPAPQRIDLGPLTNYGYENEAVLLTDLKIPGELAPGTMARIGAHVTWQVCKDICVPQDAQLTLDLPVAEREAPPDPLWQNVFDAARQAMPRPLPLGASFVQEAGRLSMMLNDDALAATMKDLAFFPLANGVLKNSAPQTWIAGPRGRILQLAPGKDAANLKQLDGVLVARDRTGARVAFTVEAQRDVASPAYRPVSWLAAFGAALLGGLLLNLMPCVFPVLSMKIIALARMGTQDARALRRDGWAYALGVVAGFVFIGALLLALRAAGAQIGWGFQLQSPAFVTFLTLLFLGLGLNLVGVFELRVAINTRHDMSALATGLLAVLVASPCTVPFMAMAVGAAVLLPPVASLLIFAGLGIGMAAPFAALGVLPRWTKYLPKPGPWMGRLRQLMAFAMFGSAAWLLWVLSVQTGRAGLALALSAALALALAAWAYGERQKGAGRWARWLWPGAALAMVSCIAGAAFAPPLAATEAGQPYENYSADRLAALQAQGRPVFIDVTADWCITCKVNEATVLETAPFEIALKAHDIAYLRADWTRHDGEITRLLNAYGRNGVPLYLFFPAGATHADILPQVLTLNTVLGIFSTRSSVSRIGALEADGQVP